jgi:hypothetical protein
VIYFDLLQALARGQEHLYVTVTRKTPPGDRVRLLGRRGPWCALMCYSGPSPEGDRYTVLAPVRESVGWLRREAAREHRAEGITTLPAGARVLAHETGETLEGEAAQGHLALILAHAKRTGRLDDLQIEANLIDAPAGSGAPGAAGDGEVT